MPKAEFWAACLALCVAANASIISRGTDAMIKRIQVYLLSIIIPVYNNAEFITATLTSIHQSITDEVELVIVNDGSTDLSDECIIAFYRENNFTNLKYISKKSWRRYFATLDLHMTGRYIGFVDSDDIVRPNYFYSPSN